MQHYQNFVHFWMMTTSFLCMNRRLDLLSVLSLTHSILPLLDSYSCSPSDLSPAKLMCPSSPTSRQVVLEWSRPHAARSLGFELLQWRGKSCVAKVEVYTMQEFGATTCRENVIVQYVDWV